MHFQAWETKVVTDKHINIEYNIVRIMKTSVVMIHLLNNAENDATEVHGHYLF